ncbi:MAG TPA: dihydrodipicolinate synthase family protein [Armatimonadota bacterium]|nr:dihydrodipicolinate synthase family protein [Armatimonadota bacterium]
MTASLPRIYSRIRHGRKVQGIAAALLPFTAEGAIAEEEFQAHLRATQAAGLQNAVNMDTGYANLLSDPEKERVLRLTREALGPGAPFVAGAFIEGREGEVADLYRREMDRIEAHGGTPILFQTARTHGLPAREKVALYREVCRGRERVLAFELGKMFAPNGEIWDEETFRGMLEIPELAGTKHSSLSKTEELKRLELRDRHRPEFRIYTGNDLGIDMIEYGSDYLLGLATFCPEKFAERDRAWEAGDAAYLELAEALQYLGNVAFRAPVPAYKHSAAHFLHMQGRIRSSRAHPDSPRRPEWEPEILRSCLERLA